jgi:hypothetical protein
MVHFLLRDAVDLTVSLRQGPPKAAGKASGRSIAGPRHGILEGFDARHLGRGVQLGDQFRPP